MRAWNGSGRRGAWRTLVRVAISLATSFGLVGALYGDPAPDKRATTSSKARRVRAFVVDANIESFVPDKVYAGQAFSVLASFRTGVATWPSALQSEVDVYIDGEPAERVIGGPQGSSRTASAPLDVLSGALGDRGPSFKWELLPLLVRAPASSPVVSPGSREVNVSLWSRADGRIVASKVMTLYAIPTPPAIASSGASLAASPKSSPGQNASLFAALAVAVASVGAALLVLLRSRGREVRLVKELEQVRFIERRSAWVDSGDPHEAAEPGDVEIEFPESILAALLTDKMVLYVGSQFGELVDEPSYAEVLRRLVHIVGIDGAELNILHNAIDRGEFDLVADRLANRDADAASLQRHINEIFRSRPRDPSDVPKVYERLAALPFSAVLTSTWSRQIDRAFAGRRPRIVTPGSGTVEDVVQDDAFFVLHLWGALEGDEPILFTSDARQPKQQGNIYARFLQSLKLRPMLFVGASLAEIEEFFAHDLPPPAATAPVRHAIFPASGLRGNSGLIWARLRDRHQLTSTTYVPEPGDPRLLSALERMNGSVRDADQQATSEDGKRRLTALKLQNIGAFKTLEIDFRPGWNVILGDNACGKSTILRAIALGLCGDAPQGIEAGTALLRSGAAMGAVTLQVGTETFATKLSRELGEFRLECSSLTPLQSGRWVVLGFPPMRGLWTRNVERVRVSGRTTRPQVGDMLPLLSGGVDTRLEDLQQWIKGLHAQERGRQLLDTFFSVLSDLTPTDVVKLREIDLAGRVIVDTDDGSIPIEQVSQGMSSTIGWVGTLLQRLYEIYPDSDHPEEETALVLVDEIDAHLHPAWQRALVGLVDRHFKAVQIIATTHSPLVVSNMSSENVLVVRRDPVDRGQIEVVRASSEMSLEGLRADQILTSSLFGLKNTRSDRDRQIVKEYSELLAVPEEKLDAAKVRRLRELKATIERWDAGGSTGDGAPAVLSSSSPQPETGLSAAADADAREAAAQVARFMKGGAQE